MIFLHTTHIELNIRRLSVGDKSLLSDSQVLLHRAPTLLRGPNGSGKSSLLRALAGAPHLTFDGSMRAFHTDQTLHDFTADSMEMRARAGLFSFWQHPPSLYGITLKHYLRAFVNLHRGLKHQPILDPYDFDDLLTPALERLRLPTDWVDQPFGLQFSGGEKKKNELLQAMLAPPAWILCDEIEAGMDEYMQRTTQALLREWVSKGIGLTLVSHQPAFYEPLGIAHILETHDGRLRSVS
jgi:Fe-S cluster assembly ATP-binding protein